MKAKDTVKKKKKKKKKYHLGGKNRGDGTELEDAEDNSNNNNKNRNKKKGISHPSLRPRRRRGSRLNLANFNTKFPKLTPG